MIVVKMRNVIKDGLICGGGREVLDCSFIDPEVGHNKRDVTLT